MKNITVLEEAEQDRLRALLEQSEIEMSSFKNKTNDPAIIQLLNLLLSYNNKMQRIINIES